MNFSADWIWIKGRHQTPKIYDGVKEKDVGLEIDFHGKETYYVFHHDAWCQISDEYSEWEQPTRKPDMNEYKVKLGYPKKNDWFISGDKLLRATGSHATQRYILQEPYADPKKVQDLIWAANKVGYDLSWPVAQAMVMHLDAKE